MSLFAVTTANGARRLQHALTIGCNAHDTASLAMHSRRRACRFERIISRAGPPGRKCQQKQESAMYLARFSYDVTPVNRQRAIHFILREVKAARQAGLNARLLVPLTRSHSAAALQFELELAHLDQLDQFRERGVGTSEETSNWMRGFSEILVSPPLVEILRVEETQ
jgi:hypothetical protein